MANKLRDVFTDNKGILMRGTVSFKDKKAEKQFTDALKKVYQRGESVQVEGVESVSMGIESGSQLFPFEQVSGDITHFMVGPSYERKDYQIEIDGEETIFPLLYCQLEDGIIIRTDTEEIFF